MDRQLDSPDLIDAWVTRELPALRYFSYGVLGWTSFIIIRASLTNYFRMRRLRKQFLENPSNAEVLHAQLREHSRAYLSHSLSAAFVYCAMAAAISIVDLVMAFFVLGSDVISHPETWTAGFTVQMIGYCLMLMGIFMAAFVAMPALQVFTAILLLSRFSNKRGGNSGLSNYLTEAQFVSVGFAQLWAMISFLMTAWWPLLTDSSFLRWMVVEGVWGSTFVWMSVALAFVAHGSKIAEAELDEGALMGCGRVLRLFGDKAADLTDTKAEEALLPRYADAVQTPREPSEKA